MACLTTAYNRIRDIFSVRDFETPFKPGVSKLRPAGRMRPPRGLCAARENFQEYNVYGSFGEQTGT